MRTTLESGAWIEHVPVQELKGKHKRTWDRAGKPSVPEEAISDDGDVNLRAVISGMNIVTYGADKTDALWALLIENWSYELPVPRLEETPRGLAVADRESFGELPLADYEEIEELFAPYAAKLNRRADPKGTTTSSSNGSSRASGAHGSRRG